MTEASAALVRLGELDELELSIEKLVAGGDGLGRFEGIPVFVPRSAPGDRLRVRLVERRPDYARAEIVAVLAAGPGRRLAPCPHFARCGGCDLQHLEDGLQTSLKVAALLESLVRLGGVELPAGTPEVIAGAPFGYRLRTQIQVGATATGIAVGYHARGSQELVAVDRCPILVPALDALLPTLPRLLPPDGPRRLDLAAGDDGSVAVAPVVEGFGHGDLTIAVGDFTYGFDARCFFQGHRGLLPALVAQAVGDWQGERAVDLYCGVGLFTLPLARLYKQVTAVEGDRVAARHARTNARHAGLQTGVEVIAQAVESFAVDLPPDLDRVVVDPPRSGLHPTVTAALVARPPRRLTYVSCHAATLARDLRRLAPAFAVERLVMIDLFPQTGHLEAIVQLARREGYAPPSPPAVVPPARPAGGDRRPPPYARREGGARPPGRPGESRDRRPSDRPPGPRPGGPRPGGPRPGGPRPGGRPGGGPPRRDGGGRPGGGRPGGESR
jgi:23S rRNA (uracil1939-C5)-methyltransferase